MAEAPVRVPGVEGRAGKFPGPSLIPALTAIQERAGWLPREELITLSREVNRPLYEIEGLISFYPHFRTSPPRKVQVDVCHDLSCWLRGSDEALSQIRARHGRDADIEIIERSCIGRCDIAPAASVNGAPVTLAGQAPVTLVPAAVGAAIAAARHAAESGHNNGAAGASDSHRASGAHKANGANGANDGKSEPRRWANDPYPTAADRYAVLDAVLAGTRGSAGIIQSLKDAGLRGMGGAGFPAGRKWDLVAAAEGTTKYVICNADESEPGTFKDREILATQPHLVLEGLLLGMLAIGAEDGWVFIRHEYGPEEHALAGEIDRLRDAGYLGPDVRGSGKRLNVEIFTSPGGYILGEESALIECMEGHRGEPRNKPPFPGTYGLHGKPTLMNSVETFAHVPVIARNGAAWWNAQGASSKTGATHAGLKFFAVSGHVEHPGVYCVPMGTTARELLDLAGGVAGGKALAAIQPGGASSNFLAPEALDVELDFATVQAAGSMLGSGAMVVMAEGTDLLAAAVNVLRFFRDESCGKCVPCRVGSAKAHVILDDLLTHGGGPADVNGTVRELATVMRRTSICGLGQVALGPVASVLKLTGK
jgi:NADH:ubiquinone oxidoreductase subunit F (NADH-binding)/NADH:ubiquinone oxidoreductase subunit E